MGTAAETSTNVAVMRRMVPDGSAGSDISAGERPVLGSHVRSASTDEGLTPLHLAAAEGLTDCETLVRNGVDIHKTRGVTCLSTSLGSGATDSLPDAVWRKDKQQEIKKSKQLHDLRQFQCCLRSASLGSLPKTRRLASD
ncbi:hypothetical protein QQF64_030950 [Cirrhinus molitorella]|uniref:Uncharacterized protein n=1 Tax=Cirrhinus molitorella TaxID=172907 RepID=A0ABR3N4S5_9TELE